jgi:transposase
MLGRVERRQEDLFVAGSLSDLIPDDYILKKVDQVLDLSWLREEVQDLYCLDNGRPGIDPESALRLMLAGFLQGIVKDRKLMREARMHLGIRWFAGFQLHEPLPHHSSLTRIRQRWGAERFKLIFRRTVEACLDAGLVDGQTVHIDATLIRADVAMSTLVEQHIDNVLAENPTDEPTDPQGPGEPTESKPSDDDASDRATSRTGHPKKFSPTDPDATLTTASPNQRMEPRFKQHTAVDTQSGVVLDVALTTGETNEGQQLLDQIDRIQLLTEQPITTVTADSSYAHAGNYQELEQNDIEAIIPPQKETARKERIPFRRFKYDAQNDVVRCPRKKLMKRGSYNGKGWFYQARPADCNNCPLKFKCVPKSARSRKILIVDGYEALLRARRKRYRWGPRERAIYNRHRGLVEGRHGEAKTQHGLGRAIRRGLANVAIQVYLTAAAMNLKRLAAAVLGFLFAYFRRLCAYKCVWQLLDAQRKSATYIFKERVENRVACRWAA